VFDGVIAIVAIAVAPDKTFQLVRLLHKQQRQQRLKNHGLSLTIWRKTRKGCRLAGFFLYELRGRFVSVL